jgi:hypothetical protein
MTYHGHVSLLTLFLFITKFVILFVLLEAQSKVPILRANCDNYISDSSKFCLEHSIEDECHQLIKVVKERCLSWSESGNGDVGIIEIPVELKFSPPCLFQITVDNTPHCVIEREHSKQLVYDDDPEFIANKTCLLYSMNKKDCSKLTFGVKQHLEKLVVDRIQDARHNSGIMNHNGSQPFLFNLHASIGNEFVFNSALLVMDKWRVHSKFQTFVNDKPKDIKTEIESKFSIVLINGDDTIINHEDRIYVTHTIKFMVKCRLDNYKNNNVNKYVCFHINNPHKNSLYLSNGLDLGCHVLKEKAENDKNMFQLQNIPYGSYDIIVYFLNPLKPFTVRKPLIVKNIGIHVLPSLIPSTKLLNKLYNGKKNENYNSCLAKKYNQMLPLPLESNNNQAFTKSFSICILAHRGKNALRNALASWEKSGLLQLASERLMFLQELKDVETDQRLSGNILNKYDIQILGEENQIGISKGMLKLVESSKSEYILFLEEDFRISDSLLNSNLLDDLKLKVNDEIRNSIQLLETKRADILRLRRRDNPGIPNCAFTWKGSEHLLGRQQTPMLNNQTVLDVHFWRDDLTKYFSNVVWRCGNVNKEKNFDTEKFFCAFSTHTSWTNNPILFSRNWFLEHIGPAALSDHSTRLEAAISFSPPLWNNKCFIVAHGNGLFMHDDVDKPQWEQTVCPPPPKIPPWWILKKSVEEVPYEL